MAVDHNKSGGKDSFGTRQVAVGANVAVMVVLAVAILVAVQWFTFKYVDYQKDFTSSGVNSLSDGTKRLVKDLKKPVHLTSMYFETDLEEENQSKYRDTVNDLFQLVQGMNRSQVEVDNINPLQDHEKREALYARLRELSVYKNEATDHRAVLDTYQKEIYPEISKALQENEDNLRQLVSTDPTLGTLPNVGAILQILRSYRLQAQEVFEAVQQVNNDELPQYTEATNVLKRYYREFQEQFQKIIDYAVNAAPQQEGLSSAALEQFSKFPDVFDPINARLKSEQEKADALKSLKLEEVLRALRSQTQNQIVIETEDEAKVLGFEDVWPPANPEQMMANRGFEDRRFNGEGAIASAVLALTQKDKAAVIFARHGGSSPFFGNMPGMPQQQQGPTYRALKEALEAANFNVYDWDLATNVTGPDFGDDGQPSRKIFIVLRPTSPPPMNPMRPQPPQGAPFTDQARNALIAAFGDAPRAIFLAGWKRPMGMMGMPNVGDYEYADYLKTKWGLEINQSAPIMTAVNFEPGKWGFRSQTAAFSTMDFKIADHEATTGITTLPGNFFEAVPLLRTKDVPDGVTLNDLVTVDPTPDIWAETNFQGLVDEIQNQQFTSKKEDDIGPPFALAVAAAKGEAKVLVMSSEMVAADNITQQRQFTITGSGQLVPVEQFPLNLTLLVNGCHWLNDNTSLMNIGRPLEISRLDIEKGPALKFWHAFAWGIWPAIMLAAGGVVYFNRRQ
jgi:hypothetical protein